MGSNDIQNVSIIEYLLCYWDKLQTEPLTPAAQSMYSALLYYLNLNSRLQPFRVSNLQICERASIRLGTLHKVKKELEGKGYVTIEKGLGQTAPAYTLTLSSKESSRKSSKDSSRKSSKKSSKDSSTSKEYKSNNNIYIGAPTLEQVKDYVKTHHYRVDPEAFYNHYNSLGWVNIYGVPIKHWQSALKSWHLKNDQVTDAEIKKLDTINRQKTQRADHDSDYINKDLPSKYDYLFTEKENT